MSTYQELFEAISDRCGAFGADLEPSTVIRDFELAVKVALIQAETGRPPTKRPCRETVQLQTRLTSLCEDLNNEQIQIEQFLRGVGHRVRL